MIQPDGSYTLSTYSEGDGALVGTHRVTYVAGSSGDVDEGEEEIPSEPTGEHDEDEGVEENPYDGLVPKQAQVTVDAGGSEINIELVPMAADPESGDVDDV
jgi:hypothetical protein